MHRTRAIVTLGVTALWAAGCGGGHGEPGGTATWVTAPVTSFPDTSATQDPDTGAPTEASMTGGSTQTPTEVAATEVSATEVSATDAEATTTGSGATDPGDPTGDPTDSDASEGGTESETGGEPPGLVCDDFEPDFVAWSLPNIGANAEVLDDTFHDSSFGCVNQDEQLTFSLLDLVGDGRPDLVITDACEVAGVGTSEWRVHEATNAGFAAKPTSWKLPDIGATAEVLDDTFHDSSFGCVNQDEQLTFALLDLVGDGRPDLVITDACEVAGVGTSGWRVHEATGAGFAADATTWKLPDIGATDEVLDDTFHDSSFGCVNQDEQLTFSLLDLTGDGRVDLVITDACEVAGVGTSEWRVHAATDVGFAANPTSWKLPDIGATDEVLDDMFHDSSFGCVNQDEQLTFSLLDLVGDERPDLVITDACEVAGVGTSEWRVHEATNAGFAANAISWKLPDIGANAEVLDDTFHDSAFGCVNQDEQLTFSLTDLTGDGRVDLVVTDACEVAGVGTSEWRVHAGMAAGFAANPMSWKLPDIGANAEVLDDMFHDSAFGCVNQDEQLTFSLTDLTGDGAGDLVLTDACEVAGVGTTTWRVFASHCAPG